MIVSVQGPGVDGADRFCKNFLNTPRTTTWKTWRCRWQRNVLKAALNSSSREAARLHLGQHQSMNSQNSAVFHWKNNTFPVAAAGLDFPVFIPERILYDMRRTGI